MARVALDLFRPFCTNFKRELYEATYDIVNDVHYENLADKRQKGDVSVIMRTSENVVLGIEPDFDFELMIMEGSDNWPRKEVIVAGPNGSEQRDTVLMSHDEAKVVLNLRADRISVALRELFGGPSHAVMENAQATGWATYGGDRSLIMPAYYSRRQRSRGIA